MDTPIPPSKDMADRPVQNQTLADNAAPLINWTAETNQSFRDAQAHNIKPDSTLTVPVQEKQEQVEVERAGYHNNAGGAIAGAILGTVAAELLYGRPYYPAPYGYPPPGGYPPPCGYPSPYGYPPPCEYPPPYSYPIPIPPIIIRPGGYHGGYPGGYHGG